MDAPILDPDIRADIHAQAKAMEADYRYSVVFDRRRVALYFKLHHKDPKAASLLRGCFFCATCTEYHSYSQGIKPLPPELIVRFPEVAELAAKEEQEAKEWKTKKTN